MDRDPARADRGHRRRRLAARPRPTHLPARHSRRGQPGPDGRLHYVGSVGTGWSDTERTTLATPLDTMASDTCPFTERPAAAGARWVLPRLVGEVRYATRTKAGRLRHPSWHRLRLDLTPGHLS
ncbi:hypothetical protein [Streptomyces californicus]|uniref:ATP dependent DNA ligase n=1 Tax=Streptomyces californicus TaxID=67351 RepID=UPI003F541653